MRIRSLLLVAVLVVLGASGRSTAAVVSHGSPVVFSFDLTIVPEDYLLLEAGGVSIQCVTSECASEFAWVYFALDGGYVLSTDENWESLVDYTRWDERYVYSRAPNKIDALIGSAPGLNDIGVAVGDGFNYGLGNGTYLFGKYYWMPTAPPGLRTLYVTFLDDQFVNTFYNVDEASIDLFWYSLVGEDLLYDMATLEGRLYDPISQVPVSQVPLPGSILFILSSMAAASGLALRKGRASLS